MLFRRKKTSSISIPETHKSGLSTDMGLWPEEGVMPTWAPLWLQAPHLSKVCATAARVCGLPVSNSRRMSETNYLGDDGLLLRLRRPF